MQVITLYYYVNNALHPLPLLSITLSLSRLLLVEMNQTLSKMPAHKDYVDAVQALVRLQEVYGDGADFTRPQGNNTKDVLNGKFIIRYSLCN